MMNILKKKFLSAKSSLVIIKVKYFFFPTEDIIKQCKDNFKPKWRKQRRKIQ